MSNRYKIALVFAFALLLTSCAQPGHDAATADHAPAAAAETGPEPTVVDPDHYSVDLENDRVRVVRIRYGAGESSVMHYHPASVAVFLTDGEVEMTLPDGTSQTMQVGAGTHAFEPAGRHQPRNVTDQPLEVVQVELKYDTPAGGAGGADPVEVDPAHYTSEFENDLVRVLRIRYGAGEESTMHFHPDSVAVFLTDHAVQMTVPDGSTSEIHQTAGDVLYIPGGDHLPKNISDAAWELILVELK